MDTQLSDQEVTNFDRWWKGHQCPPRYGFFKIIHPQKDPSIVLSWGSGIGRAATARCRTCGATKNITDYDCW